MADYFFVRPTGLFTDPERTDREEARRMVDHKGAPAASTPTCLKCHLGVLLPLSDYGQDGSSVLYKAWVCTNPECGFSIRIDKGEVTYGRKVQNKQ